MYIYIHIYTYEYIYIVFAPRGWVNPNPLGFGRLVCVLNLCAVESRIRPTGGFRLTLDKLLTLSKPNLYPKLLLTPA